MYFILRRCNGRKSGINLLIYIANGILFIQRINYGGMGPSDEFPLKSSVLV